MGVSIRVVDRRTTSSVASGRTEPSSAGAPSSTASSLIATVPASRSGRTAQRRAVCALAVVRTAGCAGTTVLSATSPHVPACAATNGPAAIDSR